MVAGMLPTQVNQRLQMTEVIQNSLIAFAERTGIPMLPAIRTDTSVAKAVKQRQFLQDFDPTCKAIGDYNAAFEMLLAQTEKTAHVAVTK